MCLAKRLWLRRTKKSLKIPGCIKNSYHMICFFPSGKILAKINICSCENCLVGNFDLCPIEKGIEISQGNSVDDSDSDTDSDVEYENEENTVVDTEPYELRSEAVLQITKPADIIALCFRKNCLTTILLVPWY